MQEKEFKVKVVLDQKSAAQKEVESKKKEELEKKIKENAQKRYEMAMIEEEDAIGKLKKEYLRMKDIEKTKYEKSQLAKLKLQEKEREIETVLINAKQLEQQKQY